MVNEIPMMFSVAGGVLLAAFFLVIFQWGVRRMETGRWRTGAIMIAFSLLYGGAIVIHSV